MIYSKTVLHLGKGGGKVEDNSSQVIPSVKSRNEKKSPLAFYHNILGKEVRTTKNQAVALKEIGK